MAAVMTAEFQVLQFPLSQYSCFKNALLFKHCSTLLNKTHTIKEHIQLGLCTLIIMNNNKLILILYKKGALKEGAPQITNLKSLSKTTDWG